MAKRDNELRRSSSSNGSLAILVAGGIIVAAIVVWALMRSANPPAASAATGDTAGGSAPLSATATSQPSGPPSQTPPAPVQNLSEEDKREVPRIALEDLKPKFDRGEVTIIDVRDEMSFEQGHIAGAMHIPLASIEAMTPAIPKDKPIVTYCT